MSKTYPRTRIDCMWGCGSLQRKIFLATASEFIDIEVYISFTAHSEGEGGKSQLETTLMCSVQAYSMCYL